MAGVADFTLTALIKADASGFRAGVQDAKNALNELQKTTGSRLQRIGDTFGGVGKALTAGLTLPLTALGGASLKAFSDYDTALIGVRKTTDISGDALKRFSKQIMGLSREMPNSAVEIANLAEVAGQLGIRTDEGGKHLINFSRIAAQMGTATNMSSEQAANAMARLANITQMPQTQFHRLGSTIVALGNKMATTESEISEMALRLAGTGHQVGLTEAQIAGLAAGMSSVGINAEAGGSAFSRVMQKMNTDVLSGGEGLQRFASVAGKTAEEFAQTWRKNPQEAIVDFVKGLGKIKESGGDVTETLKDLGINSVREIDTLARLSGAGDLLAKSFNIANKAWADGTALQKEADAASQSFANQLKLLKNALFEAGTVIGKHLAPRIGKLAEGIKKITEAIKVDDIPSIKQSFDDLKNKVSETSETSRLNAEIIGTDGKTRYNKNLLVGEPNRTKTYDQDYIEVEANDGGFKRGETYTISFSQTCELLKKVAITLTQINNKGVKLVLTPTKAKMDAQTFEVTKDKQSIEVYPLSYTGVLTGDWYKSKSVEINASEAQELALEMAYKEIADAKGATIIGKQSDKPKIILDGRRDR
ncbi:TPA: phage tail tape measure protein [Streptococcus pyogenes]|nr:phage tail tape measure protein [Streptococcus pyogenes]